MAKKLTQKEFVEKAKKVHGEKYSYKKTKYKKSQLQVIITCKIHGDFTQKPNDHLNGKGCRVCGYKLVSKKGRL